VDVHRRPVVVAGEIALRQRWSLVRQVRLVADQREAAVEAFVIA
jgi:hypothetical protein